MVSRGGHEPSFAQLSSGLARAHHELEILSSGPACLKKFKLSSAHQTVQIFSMKDGDKTTWVAVDESLHMYLGLCQLILLQGEPLIATIFVT